VISIKITCSNLCREYPSCKTKVTVGMFTDELSSSSCRGKAFHSKGYLRDPHNNEKRTHPLRDQLPSGRLTALAQLERTRLHSSEFRSRGPQAAAAAMPFVSSFFCGSEGTRPVDRIPFLGRLSLCPERRTDRSDSNLVVREYNRNCISLRE